MLYGMQGADLFVWGEAHFHIYGIEFESEVYDSGAL
jgi:hypothetical protein